MQPSILIISMNALSKTKNNGKTIETIFKAYPKKLLSHIYFTLEEEDLDFCGRALRFYTYEALDNWFRLKKRVYGEAVNEFNNDSTTYNDLKFLKFIQTKSRISRNRSKSRKPVSMEVKNKRGYFIAECLWGPDKWYMRRIREYLSDNRPELIFYQANMYSFLHKIVIKLADEYKIPIIVQCTDDYTRPHIRESALNRALNKYYMKNFKALMKKSSVLLAISEVMAREYERLYFKGKSFVFSNFIERDNPEIDYSVKKDRKILYAGNLGLGRWKIIIMLGQALDEYNKESDFACTIDIYSGERIPDEMKLFLAEVSSVRFCGFLEPSGLNKKIIESDYLLHCESFDEISKRITRLSISTKIGEYIASARCIIAIGPGDVASIQYLKENKLAKVITTDDRTNLLEEIEKFLGSTDMAELYLRNSKEEKNKKFNRRYMEDVLIEMIDYAMKTEKRQ